MLEEISLEKLEQLAREASEEAIAEAHAKGLSTTHGKPDGTIYKLYPDGHEEILKQGDGNLR